MRMTPAEALAYLDSPFLECLICGRELAVLGKHVRSIHGISAEEYKVRFGLPLSRGLTGQVARQKMSEAGKARPEPASFAVQRGTPTAQYPRARSPYKRAVDVGHGFKPGNRYRRAND